MTGVEILAVEEVAVAFGMDWAMFILFGMLFSLVLGVLAWAAAEESNASVWGTRISVVVALLVSFTLSGLMGANLETGEPTEFETHYKVTITDEVPMNEFLERYEIVDQDGKIFTVKEAD
jgi:hypothetical protein